MFHIRLKIAPRCILFPDFLTRLETAKVRNPTATCKSNKLKVSRDGVNAAFGLAARAVYSENHS